VLTNWNLNQRIPSKNIAVTFDRNTKKATFTFPGYANGKLPGGYYLAVLPAGSVADAATNRPMAADYTLSFMAPFRAASALSSSYPSSSPSWSPQQPVNRDAQYSAYIATTQTYYSSPQPSPAAYSLLTTSRKQDQYSYPVPLY